MKDLLIVIGSINIDHVLRVSDFPKPGETLISSDYQINYGGKGANQAVAASRAGADTLFVSAIGTDSLGKAMKAQLAQDNINTDFIAEVDDQTGLASIMVSQKGENQIIIYPGANQHISASQIAQAADYFARAKIVLLQLEIPIPSIEYAVEIAKENRCQVVLNPAPAQKLSDKLLANVDIITPNETEAEALTGIKVDSEEGAIQASTILHRKGITTVIITLGSRGCWYSINGIGKLIASYKVNVVDTTAAGDTFNGYFVAGLLDGQSAEDAVRLAHKAASISVTKKGAQNSIPWKKETESS